MKKVLSIILCAIMLMSALSVLAYADVVGTIMVDVVTPYGGENPDFDPQVPYGVNYVIDNFTWLDVETETALGEYDEFVSGKTYKLEIWLSMAGSDLFDEDSLEVYFSGEDATIEYKDAYDVCAVKYYEVVDFDENAIPTVAVEMESSMMACELVPFSLAIYGEGKHIDQRYNSNGFINGIRWKSDKRTDYYKKGDRFDANSVNTIEVRLVADGECYFTENVDGKVNFMPATSTVSNGGRTLVLKYKFEKLQKLASGWHTSEDGKKFYIKSDGTPYTSKLISVSGKKYYVGKDGAVYTSKLISVSGNKYYMGKDGVAYTSRLISVSGKKYYMGKDGIAYKSRLISVDGKKYYMGSDAVAYTSKLASIDGKKYYFGKDGVAYKSKLISVSGKKYYIGKDCIAYKSKFASLSGKKYYFGSDCVMYKSKTFSVSGVKWRADSNGVCKKA